MTPPMPIVATTWTLSDVLTLDETERAELLALYETADVETVEIEHAADLPRNYLRFRRDEGEAEAALTLDPDLIPGVLQTPEYAEALAFSARRLAADQSWSDKAREERAQRGALITRESNPLKLRALIDVAALYRAVGGAGVMSRQYDHLLTMGSLPNVEVRAIPFSAGACCVANGALVLLSFPLPDAEPLAAYLDAGLAGMFAVQDPEQVRALSAVWDDVAALALSAEQTAELIREIRDNSN